MGAGESTNRAFVDVSAASEEDEEDLLRLHHEQRGQDVVYGRDKAKEVEGFTRKYNIHRLVYFEEFGDIRDAIAREKQIKGWLRAKKVALIESMNPEWKELAPEWMKKPRPAARCHPEANR